jgi:hypothetical protein
LIFSFLCKRVAHLLSFLCIRVAHLLSLFVLSYYVSLRSEFRAVVSVPLSDEWVIDCCLG